MVTKNSSGQPTGLIQQNGQVSTGNVIQGYDVMSYITVCKNVIASNNKRDWVDPDPAIRISNTKSGKVVDRASIVAILDKHGQEVARVISTMDGKPVVKCGAKVAIETKFAPAILEK